LSDRRQRELELCAVRAAKAQSVKPQNAFEVREQHLDLLAIAARLRERLCLGIPNSGSTDHVSRPRSRITVIGYPLAAGGAGDLAPIELRSPIIQPALA
jgi:hypothetical protein